MNARDKDEPDFRSDVSMESLDTPRCMGVVGAGQMGAGIAAALVRAGLETAMVDLNAAMLEAGRKRVADQVAGKGGGGQLPPEQPNDASSRLQTSTSLEILSHCDVIIEAVTEDESLKTGCSERSRQWFRPIRFWPAIPRRSRSRAWRSRRAQRGRFAGMHFFHPVNRMQLVEVIHGEETSDDTVAVLVALAKGIGKTPIVVRDCPGFLVTRVMYPYLARPSGCSRKGYRWTRSTGRRRRSACRWARSRCMDLVGLDTVLAITRVMAEGYPTGRSRAPCSRPWSRLAGWAASPGRASGDTQRMARAPVADSFGAGPARGSSARR